MLVGPHTELLEIDHVVVVLVLGAVQHETSDVRATTKRRQIGGVPLYRETPNPWGLVYSLLPGDRTGRSPRSHCQMAEYCRTGMLTRNCGSEKNTTTVASFLFKHGPPRHRGEHIRLPNLKQSTLCPPPKKNKQGCWLVRSGLSIGIGPSTATNPDGEGANVTKTKSARSAKLL